MAAALYVVDRSVSLAWLLEEQADDYTEAALDAFGFRSCRGAALVKCRSGQCAADPGAAQKDDLREGCRIAAAFAESADPPARFLSLSLGV